MVGDKEREGLDSDPVLLWPGVQSLSLSCSASSQDFLTMYSKAPG